jgi:hypothetical protein
MTKKNNIFLAGASRGVGLEIASYLIEKIAKSKRYFVRQNRVRVAWALPIRN